MNIRQPRTLLASFAVRTLFRNEKLSNSEQFRLRIDGVFISWWKLCVPSARTDAAFLSLEQSNYEKQVLLGQNASAIHYSYTAQVASSSEKQAY